MGKKIVIALGGNALGKNLPEQMAAVKKTAAAIADLIEDHHEVVIVHGNGPQVGMIQNAMTELKRSDPDKYDHVPLSVCVALSQGYIGYDLQNSLKEELLDRGIKKDCATVLTQVEVDLNDPAFDNPTKPIGSFMTKEEADALAASQGCKVVEDSGRGYRQVVASPKPKSIVELDTIRSLMESDHIVIACGGGGIPVYHTTEHHLKGAAAVIDKDFYGAPVDEDPQTPRRGYGTAPTPRRPRSGTCCSSSAPADTPSSGQARHATRRRRRTLPRGALCPRLRIRMPSRPPCTPPPHAGPRSS